MADPLPAPQASKGWHDLMVRTFRMSLALRQANGNFGYAANSISYRKRKAH